MGDCIRVQALLVRGWYVPQLRLRRQQLPRQRHCLRPVGVVYGLLNPEISYAQKVLLKRNVIFTIFPVFLNIKFWDGLKVLLALRQMCAALRRPPRLLPQGDVAMAHGVIRVVVAA
jgi:hypothetical protein